MKRPLIISFKVDFACEINFDHSTDFRTDYNFS